MKNAIPSILILLLSQGCYQSMGPKEEAQPQDIDTGDELDSIVDLDTDFEKDTDSESETEASTDTDTLTDTELDTQINWITIPGGSFQMGQDNCYSYTQPVHTVNVPTFEMAQTETTVAQYALCVASGQCTPPYIEGECSPLDDGNWGVQGFEYHPVNCVTWPQAEEFCQWVGARLPSESEWEYAASSGGQDNSNPWGDEPNWCSYAVIGQTGAGCFDGCGTGRTWPVCGKPLGDTDHGLCDMIGNVWEIMGDSFHTDYNGAPVDGSMWTTDVQPSWGDYRVKRGFSFSCYNQLYQCSNVVSSRSATHENYETARVGFRCAR